jgi:hypothetical protein
MRQKIEMIQSDPRPKVAEASKKGAKSLTILPTNAECRIFLTVLNALAPAQ